MAQQTKTQNSPIGLANVLPITVIGFLLAWLYVPQMISMVENWWHDPNYSHGFLVPLVSCGLIWRRKNQLSKIKTQPNPLGLLFILFGLLLLIAGQLGHEFYLQRISIIPVLWGTCVVIWGLKLGVRVLFPFAYLALMVPLPYVIYDSIAFPLRLIGASIAGWTLELIGIPVLVEGNILHLPYIVLNVVDACSGIRSLISLLAVGVIMAYMVLPNRWVKVLVVAFVIPVAVFTNAMRVVVTGLLAKEYGTKALEGAFHDFTGWLVFMGAFLILALLTFVLNKLTQPKEQRDEA